MSVTSETSQSATGPYFPMAAVGLALYAWTAVFRVALVVKVPGCNDGGCGGDGGDGGGAGDRNCTTKDLVPWSPFAKAKLCSKPGAAHSFPFQPSPYESVMLRVHVAPSATANGTGEVYGAPPLSVVPSEQLRLQVTSLGYAPAEQVISEEIDGGNGGGGGCGGGGGSCGGDGGCCGGCGHGNRQTGLANPEGPPTAPLLK